MRLQLDSDGHHAFLAGHSLSIFYGADSDFCLGLLYGLFDRVRTDTHQASGLIVREEQPRGVERACRLARTPALAVNEVVCEHLATRRDVYLPGLSFLHRAAGLVGASPQKTLGRAKAGD